MIPKKILETFIVFAAVILFFGIILSVGYGYQIGVRTFENFDGTVKPGKSYTIDGVKHDPIPGLKEPQVKVSDKHAKKLKSLYQKFLTVAESNGIQFWAAGGTMLGALRHGGIIPWDDDIDLYIGMENVEKMRTTLKDELKKLNVETGYVVHSYGRFFKIFDLQNQDVFIDIFIAKMESGKVYICNNKIDIEKCNKYRKNEVFNNDDVFPLKKVTFEDTYMYVPNDSHKVAKTQYGSGYMEPKVYKPHIGMTLYQYNQDLDNVSIVKYIYFYFIRLYVLLFPWENLFIETI